MRILPETYIKEFVSFLKENKEELSKEAIAKEKRRLCLAHNIKDVPTDITLLTHLSEEELAFAEPFLLTKPVRSRSGVTVVAIMTRPGRCPHGRCTYCPGGPGSAFGDVPQSYTGNEPASMRAKRSDYDAYLQVFSRLEQLIVAGHNPEKVELIIMGGTFPSEDKKYQEEFIARAFQALNDFSRKFYEEECKEGKLLIEKFRDFFLLPGSPKDNLRVKSVKENIGALQKEREQTLEEAQTENETAKVRCVGLTIETRPDYGRVSHGDDLLRFGCTRIELGIQTLNDKALSRVHRGHDVAESVSSIADLRDLGFKLNFHMMLGLPGMTPEEDFQTMKALFADSRFRPDMLKIYPCMVMKGTPLFEEYKAGDFKPLDTEKAADLIANILEIVPRYCRVMRVQRDIPTPVTEAGVDRTNLRQLVEEKMKEKGIQSADIRAREIRERPIKKAVLNVIGYDASGGEEFFISIDDPTQDALIGFCRLRFPARQLRREFDVRTAIVRELHVYGKQTGIGVIGIEGSAQHRGFGSQLLHVAERIAREHGKQKLLVISGVGVRDYYRKLGYEREGPYMAKKLCG